jgi:hypothetical protein
MGIGIGAAGGGFCRGGQAAHLAAPLPGAGVQLNEYERILATTNLFDTLGHPRSWSIVQQGFLPISPDRVLILEPEHLGLPVGGWRDEQCRIRERTQDAASAESPSCVNGHCRRAAENGVSPEKLRLILWLTNELTQYYSAPEWWEEWAYSMTFREALGSTGVGRGFAMPQQYQYDVKTCATTTIKTMNAGLDWWLVLIPGGTKHWEPLDDLPVYAMLTYVSAGPAGPGPQLPGLQIRTMWHADQAARLFAGDSSNAFVELAQMDRVSASRLVNRHFVWAPDDSLRARKEGAIRPSRMMGDK